MRNKCVAYAVVAAIFAALNASVWDNRNLVGPWLIGCWAMLSLAAGFHEAAKR
jgi:hypothetical protein